MKTLQIIGIGMGNPDTITTGALRLIEKSQAIIGARRMLESFPLAKGEKHDAIVSSEIMEWITQHPQYNTITVLMSGDVGFFSGAKKLSRLAEETGCYQVVQIPGISSLQYFCAQLQTSWDDVKVISLHGREANFVGEIRTHQKTFLLTDSQWTPAAICRALAEAGLGYVSASVGQRLSYQDEQIVGGSAAELKEMDFDSLSVVLIQNHKVQSRSVVTHGVSDERFIRGKVPMTKEEVRSVTLSKMQIEEDDIIYDVGAGTGSVSIEMALQAVKGRVYAVEANREGIALIEQNKAVFQANNLVITEGFAPEALKCLPVPDKAFIGGSKGNLAQIADCLLEKNPSVRIVINVIALESLTEALEVFRTRQMDDVDVVQVSVAKAKELGSYHMMMGQNPVYILTAQKRENL